MSSKTTSTTKSGAFLSTPNTSKLHWTGRLMYRHDTSSHFAYADNTRPTLDMACWLWCWDNNAAHSHFDQWTAEYCSPALGRSAHTYLTDPRVNDAHCDKMPASYINLPIVTGIQPTALCRKRPHCRFMEPGHLLNALWVWKRTLGRSLIECGMAGQHYQHSHFHPQHRHTTDRNGPASRSAWVRLNRLHTGVGRFRFCSK